MVTKQDAQELFNRAFDARFNDLQAMFESQTTAHATPKSTAPQNLQNLQNLQNCDACSALSVATVPAPPCSHATSWLLLALLVAGIALMIFGVIAIFRRRREVADDAKRHQHKHKYAAPHVVAGAPHVVAGGAHVANELEESDPDKIIPDASEGNVVFVFFHALWCGHCKEFRPVFESCAKASQGKAKFKTVVSDVLQKSPHAEKIALRGFPTVVAFVNGEPHDSLVGNQGKEALQEFIRKHAS
jgi:thiol-disulfide isomerase/thioredoxin